MDHFAEFEKCYGKKPDGTSKRTAKTTEVVVGENGIPEITEQVGEESRFRDFSRDFVRDRGDNLDISWLKDDDATSSKDLPEPDVIATMISDRLKEALAEMDALTELLEPTQ